MKKLIVFLTAILCISTSFGCTDKKSQPESTPENSGNTAVLQENIGETTQRDENFRQTIYGEKRINLPTDFWDFRSMKYVNEQDCFYILYNDMDFNLKLRIYSADFTEYTDKTLIENSGGIRFVSAVDNSGNVTVLSSEKKSQEVADNADDHFRHSGYFYTLTEFDSNQQQISSIDVPDMGYLYETKGAEPVSIERYTDSSYLVVTNEGLVILENDGTIAEIPDSSLISHAGVYAEGKAAAAEYQTLSLIDENLRFSENISLSNAIADGNIIAGDEDFSLYITCVDGIYGLTENKEICLVADFSASYLPIGDISRIEQGKDGEFLIYGSEKGWGFISRIFPRPNDYTLERETITLACTFNNENYLVLANSFNKYSDRYFLEIKESADFDTIKMDILTGNSPDIIKYNDITVMENLVNLGGITDMYPLMEQYGGVKKDDILDNVVNALEYNASLYALSPTFEINCILADKSFVGEEYNSWSFEEFFSLYENRPSGMKLSYDYYARTPEDIFRRFCSGYFADNLAAWVDGDACHFNSEEFVRLLEFCRYAETAPADTSAADVALSLKNRTGMICFADCLRNIEDFRSLNTYQLGLEDLSFLSYPDTESGGTLGFQEFYSITENAPCKEGAWEFVSFIMSEEYQASENDNSRLYTLKKAFENNLKLNTLKEGEENPTGTLSYNGYEVPYKLYLTEDEAEIIRKIVSQCTAKSYNSDHISSICNEEFLLYINGEYSAEECAEMIQNRVSIMLSEQS